MQTQEKGPNREDVERMSPIKQTIYLVSQKLELRTMFFSNCSGVNPYDGYSNELREGQKYSYVLCWPLIHRVPTPDVRNFIATFFLQPITQKVKRYNRISSFWYFLIFL